MRQLMELLNSFKYSAKRIETLPLYKIENEEWEEYQNYIKGIPYYSFEPSEWYKEVEKNTKEGKIMERIRVIQKVISPYINFEFETGYVPNSVAGEKIYTIEEEKYNLITNESLMGDYWIFDDTTVLKMVYDSSGGFIESIKIEDMDKIKDICGYYTKLNEHSSNFTKVLGKIRNRYIILDDE